MTDQKPPRPIILADPGQFEFLFFCHVSFPRVTSDFWQKPPAWRTTRHPGEGRGPESLGLPVQNLSGFRLKTCRNDGNITMWLFCKSLLLLLFYGYLANPLPIG